MRELALTTDLMPMVDNHRVANPNSHVLLNALLRGGTRDVEDELGAWGRARGNRACCPNPSSFRTRRWTPSLRR